MDNFNFSSRRSPVNSSRGMVATSQPLAVAAGIEILNMGGNAADAAVATAAALNVSEPTSTGIGGDAFALYYDASTRTVSSMNASGRAPEALTLERLKREGFDSELPPFHPYTVTVPGACAGWCDMVEKHGLLDISQVLIPAIRLAEEGFPVAPVTAYFWKRSAQRQLSNAPNGSELTINGRGPHAGEIFRNPGLARTFRSVADGGKDAYYNGDIGEAVIKVLQDSGGCMQKSDLAAHRTTWDTPISTNYHGFQIWECPPNGQGLTTLLGLNILAETDISDSEILSAERLHLQIEAMRLAFADTRWYITDPAHSKIPIEQLLSSEYAETRRKLLNRQRATLDFVHGSPVTSSDTVYLSVVDADGNACSFINSNYMGFGTGIVPKGWGFSLQNRGHNFSLDPQHPNKLVPGKRPYHTIIPGMITTTDNTAGQHGDLFACFGVMGGFMQPQGHLQVIISLTQDGLNPQEALDLPRFCIKDGTSGGKVALEEGIPIEVMAQLARMGHPVFPVSGYDRAIFGRGQIIMKDQHYGTLSGGSDPRADGCAMSQ